MSQFMDAYENLTGEERANLHAVILAGFDTPRPIAIIHDATYRAIWPTDYAPVRASYDAPGRSRHKKGKR
jgi:hypothetical protein